MESWGLRVSRTKTEYLAPLASECRLTVDNQELPTVSKLKNLGSILDAEGGVETDCKNRICLAWNKWRELTGVVCDKKVPLKLKHQLYKTAIKSTLCYVRECWTLKMKDKQPLSKTEMCWLRWIQVVSLTEHQTNMSIWKKAGVLDLPSHLMK